jgi:hypothetical protein
MKNRIVIDFSVFHSMLRELKAMRRELKSIKGEPESKPLPKRKLRDAVSTPEVLHILKVSPMTLMSYEKKGLIKFHKEGRSKVYSETEVRAFRKSRGRAKRLTKNTIQRRFGKVG